MPQVAIPCKFIYTINVGARRHRDDKLILPHCNQLTEREKEMINLFCRLATNTLHTFYKRWCARAHTKMTNLFCRVATN